MKSCLHENSHLAVRSRFKKRKEQKNNQTILVFTFCMPQTQICFFAAIIFGHPSMSLRRTAQILGLWPFTPRGLYSCTLYYFCMTNLSNNFNLFSEFGLVQPNLPELHFKGLEHTFGHMSNMARGTFSLEFGVRNSDGLRGHETALGNTWR